MPPPQQQPPQDVQALYAEIRRRMVESGDWDHIRTILSTRLNESGWIDEVRDKSKEKARTMDPLSFDALFESVRGGAQNSIPLSVKREITQIIRQFIQKHFV